MKYAKRRKRLVIVICVVLVSVLMVDTLFIGNIAYYAKWAQCGSKPVVLTHPQKIGFGSRPRSDVVVINPIWLRTKAAPIGPEASLHCSIDGLQAEYGNSLEICSTDSIEHYLWPSSPCQ